MILPLCEFKKCDKGTELKLVETLERFTILQCPSCGVRYIEDRKMNLLYIMADSALISAGIIEEE